jgi:hypothetical protein
LAARFSISDVRRALIPAMYPKTIGPEIAPWADGRSVPAPRKMESA